MFDLQGIAEILELLAKHDITEFKLERGEEKLSLRRGPEHETVAPLALGTVSTYAPPSAGFQNAIAQIGAPVAAAAPVPSASASTAAAVLPASVKEITSPMVGTFYRRPSPDAPSYVDPGKRIKKGDTLCIVEAMKLMNEIESEWSGTIVEVCLEDGQMVEYGEVLFRIDTAS